VSHRDNGLRASSYVRVVDVETQLVEGLLDRLREEEVAAYVAPAPGKRGPYGDVVLPVAPSDSLYVDSDRTEHARGVVQRYLLEVREELAWASIVAGFDAPVEDGLPRWPVSEDVDEDPPDLPELEPKPVEELRADVPLPEDHFEPPPPPPVPVPDTINRFAWAAVIGGPLFLVLGAILSLDLSGWMGLLALSAFAGGFVTLVARMKDRPPPGLDGDDGAVV
jgi:hypothetical protein